VAAGAAAGEEAGVAGVAGEEAGAERAVVGARVVKGLPPGPGFAAQEDHDQDFSPNFKWLKFDCFFTFLDGKGNVKTAQLLFIAVLNEKCNKSCFFDIVSDLFLIVLRVYDNQA